MVVTKMISGKAFVSRQEFSIMERNTFAARCVKQ